jgi:ABC-type Mn2+/Zn2+ transport system permease subunit
MLAVFTEDFLLLAFLACLVLSVVLPFYGFQIIQRGIVFIDLALAQIASLGIAVALLFNVNAVVCSLLFTLIGSLILFFAGLRKEEKIQEGIIGAFYALSASLTILILSKVPHGEADVTHMLFGNLLSVSMDNLIKMTVILGVVWGLVLVLRKKFMTVSSASSKVSMTGKEIFWHIVFYISLAITISYAIKLAGVLVVFAYLIMPAVTAMLIFKKATFIYLVSVIIAILASYTGIGASFMADFPFGASIITFLGIFFVCALIVNAFLSKRSQYLSEAGQSSEINPE